MNQYIAILVFFILATVCFYMVFSMCKKKYGYVTIGDLVCICVLSIIPVVNLVTIIAFAVVYIEENFGRSIKDFFDKKVF